MVPEEAEEASGFSITPYLSLARWILGLWVMGTIRLLVSKVTFEQFDSQLCAFLNPPWTLIALNTLLFILDAGLSSPVVLKVFRLSRAHLEDTWKCDTLFTLELLAYIIFHAYLPVMLCARVVMDSYSRQSWMWQCPRVLKLLPLMIVARSLVYGWVLVAPMPPFLRDTSRPCCRGSTSFRVLGTEGLWCSAFVFSFILVVILKLEEFYNPRRLLPIIPYDWLVYRSQFRWCGLPAVATSLFLICQAFSRAFLYGAELTSKMSVVWLYGLAMEGVRGALLPLYLLVILYMGLDR